MEIMDVIFCRIMEGLGLSVGMSCSGARTFVECMAIALMCCAVDRAISFKIFAVAALCAIIANFIRCFILLTWQANSWRHYQIAHDYGGMAIVALSFFVIASFHPRKKIK